MAKIEIEFTQASSRHQTDLKIKCDTVITVSEFRNVLGAVLATVEQIFENGCLEGKVSDEGKERFSRHFGLKDFKIKE